MSLTAVFINLVSAVLLILAFAKDRQKAKQSLKAAAKSFLGILPVILITIIAVGLLLSFVPPSRISQIIGEGSGLGGVLLIALIGTILFIPAIVAFPLAGSFLRSGASVTAVAAFITTLTMIGFVTLPLEIREFGKKMALLRNVFSFFIALIIAFIMGKIL